MNEQTDLIQYTKKRSLCRRLLPLLLAMGLLLVGCSGGTEPSALASAGRKGSETPGARLRRPFPEWCCRRGRWPACGCAGQITVSSVRFSSLSCG